MNKECAEERKIRIENKRKLKLAKVNESYSRKNMEFYQEEIRILQDSNVLEEVAWKKRQGRWLKRLF